MASAQPRARKSLPARLLDLINPLRDPSFTVAIVLTVVMVVGQHPQPAQIALIFFAAWLAVKSAVWFFVNTIFSIGFLARKGWWVMRHPRLAWRLLDALGTEEIIVGGLHPDMFMADDGMLQEAQLGRVVPAMPRGGFRQPAYDDRYSYDQGMVNANAPAAPPAEYYAEIERAQGVLQAYEHLIFDWVTFTEEKWRAVSDSQLGWKPLRGRWNGWDEIYSDSYAARTNDRMARAAAAAGEALRQRFENARSRGSAASSVACFLRDLDTLRQSLNIMNSGDPGDSQRNGTGYGPQGGPPSATRTGKSPIIRDPMRVIDAN
jgi:hypothetical protein